MNIQEGYVESVDRYKSNETKSRRTMQNKRVQIGSKTGKKSILQSAS